MGCSYMQEYRSGHNEAVLKTVRPKATGVRIPLPAPKNKDTPCGCPLFFATVRGSRTPLCDSPSRRMGFAFECRNTSPILNLDYNISIGAVYGECRCVVSPAATLTYITPLILCAIEINGC